MSTSAMQARSVARASCLWVEREGIRFWNVTPERVRIEVAVENRGRASSEPTALVLQAAPFGAFLRWQPLTKLVVRELEPGEKTIVRCERPRPKVRAVADFSGLLPPRVLTALGMPDEGAKPSAKPSNKPVREPEPEPERVPKPFSLRAVLVTLATMGGRALAPDLHELVGRGSFHWAGNINVLIGERAVERHMAQALRIHPGRTNIAMFMVGGDAAGYLMRVRGSGSAWPHFLVDPASGSLTLHSDGAFRLPMGTGVVPRPVLFGCRPPASCEPATIEVHVEQQPLGEKAVVEFSFDPDAAGPGCYTV